MTNALPELDPSSTALLLMDFQHAMVGAIGDAAAGPVVANAVAALEWARANKIHVAHLRVGFEPTEAAGIPHTNKFFAPYAARARSFTAHLKASSSIRSSRQTTNLC
jgi:nicotinamidase-related amidase